MSALAFAWGLLPWWSWLAVVAGVVIVSAAGLWPVVFGLARLVPWPVWAIALAGLVAVMALRGHDENLTEAVTTKVTKERDVYWRGREDASNKAQAAREAALQLRLDTALSFAENQATAHAKELAAQAKRQQERFAALAQRRTQDVTDEARRLCPVLDAGVVRHFNDGAAGANGDPSGDGQAAAGPGAGADAAAASVSLDAYVDAVEATQAALGTCRTQVIGWQGYYTKVLAPWISSTVESLQSCVPRGEP